MRTDALRAIWSARVDGGGEKVIRTEVIADDSFDISVVVITQAFEDRPGDPAPVEIDDYVIRAPCLP